MCGSVKCGDADQNEQGENCTMTVGKSRPTPRGKKGGRKTNGSRGSAEWGRGLGNVGGLKNGETTRQKKNNVSGGKKKGIHDGPTGGSIRGE